MPQVSFVIENKEKALNPLELRGFSGLPLLYRKGIYSQYCPSRTEIISKRCKGTWDMLPQLLLWMFTVMCQNA